MPNISSESPRQPEFSRVLPSQVGQKDSHPQAEEAYQPVTTFLQIGNELHGISTHADCPAHIKAMHEELQNYVKPLLERRFSDSKLNTIKFKYNQADKSITILTPKGSFIHKFKLGGPKLPAQPKAENQRPLVNPWAPTQEPAKLPAPPSPMRPAAPMAPQTQTSAQGQPVMPGGPAPHVEPGQSRAQSQPQTTQHQQPPVDPNMSTVAPPMGSVPLSMSTKAPPMPLRPSSAPVSSSMSELAPPISSGPPPLLHNFERPARLEIKTPLNETSINQIQLKVKEYRTKVQQAVNQGNKALVRELKVGASDLLKDLEKLKAAERKNFEKYLPKKWFGKISDTEVINFMKKLEEKRAPEGKGDSTYQIYNSTKFLELQNFTEQIKAILL